MSHKILHAGGLTLRQEPISETTIDKLNPDVVFSIVSWERRASALSTFWQSWPGSIDVIRFESPDAKMEERKDRVQAEIVARSPRHKFVKLGPSVDFRKNASVIESIIQDYYAKLRRPINMLVDISCLPKDYILFVLALGFRREFVGRLDFLYSEGRYHYEEEHATKPTTSYSMRGLISDGEWSSLQIPYLESAQYIPDARDLIASLGGELTLSVPFIQRFEPRRVELLLVTHSDGRMGPPKDAREKRALGELESQPHTTKTSFEIEDVVGVAKHAIDFCRKSPSTATTALAIGPKPHAVALGVAAMCLPMMEVVCRIPSRYIPSEVDATGRAFHYSIEDRFEPYAYLMNAQ
jgi:hypothetical protein